MDGWTGCAHADHWRVATQGVLSEAGFSEGEEGKNEVGRDEWTVREGETRW